MSELIWYKVLEDAEKLHEGRVMSVTAGHKGVCPTTQAELEAGMPELLAHDGPGLLEVMTDAMLL